MLASAFLFPSLKPHDSNRTGMIIPTAAGRTVAGGKVLEPRPRMVMLVYLGAFWIAPTYRRASQVAPAAKNPPANAGDVRDMGSIPGLGRFPGGRMATHSSILAWRIPMERGGWQALIHRVEESRTRLKQLSMHPCTTPISIHLSIDF